MSEQGLSAAETLAGLEERGITPVDNPTFMQRFDFADKPSDKEVRNG